jgi:glycine oxidase
MHIVVVGAGIVGTMLAYSLSRQGLTVTVIEAEQPGKAATGAALGVMMAVCSQKLKGDLVDLRLQSLQMYEQLVPELIDLTGQEIRFNRAGILCLYRSDLGKTKSPALIAMRQSQGYNLEWLDRAEIQKLYPQVLAESGLYSPQDRAIAPQDLISALVLAARKNGVKFQLESTVTSLDRLPAADFTVITAGLGSNQILTSLGITAPLVGVGGQALSLELPGLNLKTAIHAETETGDLNLVSLGSDRYWLGATVEFGVQDLPRPENIKFILEQAIGFCPKLSQAKILNTWAGYRPRPQFQRSPILGFLPNQPKVLIATGHYRNGILMAPITAKIIQDLILDGDSIHPWREFSLNNIGQPPKSPNAGGL